MPSVEVECECGNEETVIVTTAKMAGICTCQGCGERLGYKSPEGEKKVERTTPVEV